MIQKKKKKRLESYRLDASQKPFCFCETEVWEYTSGLAEVKSTLISFCISAFALRENLQGILGVGTREKHARKSTLAPAFARN